ncbi:MAG: sodium:proton antiporter [Clostridia bacterium]|nr:sodium:proton antiporter [Clostridia bacterium]
MLFLVFFPMIAAVVSYLIGRVSKTARDLFMMLSCGVTLAAVGYFLSGVIAGQEYVSVIPGMCGFGLSFRLDGFRVLYALIGGVMWLMTALLSKQYFAHHYHNRNRYYFFFLMTLGATLGVFLSDDLFTTFIFFEIMSFTSYTWVAHDETPGAMRAAETYLAVAIIGGMVMLVGLFLLKYTVGTLAIGELHAACAAAADKTVIWAASLCILCGFGAKAGMFPMHIWLPKAHPVAPAPASALLSGILTKSGIFGVIVVSANIFREDAAWGNMLLVLALITMLGGAVLAVFSTNLKRTLACSSMSQIGFILTGIAMSCLLGHDNALAARGALLYMLNHSLFKLILFMAAGVVYMNLHKLELDDVAGFGRGKWLLHFAFLMGAVGLMGVPLFSGYVSKTLIHEGIVEYVHHLEAHGHSGAAYTVAEWVYLFSGGLTGAYMIKLYICLFWQKNKDHLTQTMFKAKNGKYMTPLSAFALTVSAVLVPLLGVKPNATMDRIADFAGGFLHAGIPAHEVHYFTWVNLKGSCISIAIGLAVYLLFIRLVLMKREGDSVTHKNLWPAKLDMEDRLYRPAINGLLAIGGVVASIGDERLLEKYVYVPVIKALVFAGTFAARVAGSLTDAVAVTASHLWLSVHRNIHHLHVGNFFTEAIGKTADAVAEGLNHTVLQEKPLRHHIAGFLAGVWEGLLNLYRAVSHTMSYALVLFAFGLLATIVYLLTY